MGWFKKTPAAPEHTKWYAAKWYPALQEWGFSTAYRSEEAARERMLEMNFDQVVPAQEKWRLLEDQHTRKLERELGIK